MKTTAIKTRVFKEGEDIVAFIRAHIPRVEEGSILAITSKIVALGEGRVISPRNKTEKAALIRRESTWQLKTRSPWKLTVRDGSVVVNAGLDDSNADGKIVLLPKDSYRAADKLRKQLKKAYRVKRLGIVITDSRINPLRAGVTGLAVGYAGFEGLRDYRGKPDIFGRTMKVTMTDVADSVATVATLVMGEGAERQPLAIIEAAPVKFVERVNRREVRIPMKDDLYAPLFNLPASRPTASRTRKRKGKR